MSKLYGNTDFYLRKEDEDLAQQGFGFGEGEMVAPEGFRMDMRTQGGDEGALY